MFKLQGGLRGSALTPRLVIAVEHDNEKFGILVDELLAQQQLVIKSLEENYRRVDGISGATILGDGRVALILDISGIVKMAGVQHSNSLFGMPTHEGKQDAQVA